MHQVAKLSLEQRRLLLFWIDTYGHSWKPGYLQYRSTESYREESIRRARKRNLKKKEEIAEYQKLYRKENRKKLNEKRRTWKKTEKGRQSNQSWNTSEKGKKYKHDWYLKKRKNDN